MTTISDIDYHCPDLISRINASDVKNGISTLHRGPHSFLELALYGEVQVSRPGDFGEPHWGHAIDLRTIRR